MEEIKESAEAMESEFIADQIELSGTMDRKSPPKTRHAISTVALTGIFLMGVIGFLYFAKVFFLPLMLALVLSFLFTPVVKVLARFSVPRTVGAAVVLLMVLLAVGNGVTLLTKPATEFMSQLPESLHRAEDKLRHFIYHAGQLNKAAAEVKGITDGNQDGSPATKVQVSRTSLADSVFSATTSFVTGAIETTVLFYFLLAYGEVFLQKLVKTVPRFRDKKQVTQIAHEVQQNISTFLFTISVINACLGVLVGFGVWLGGLGNPVLWGAMAALLNFIPYFGPMMGVFILALAGLLTFDSVGRALIPPLIYLGLHALESNFVTPMILGRRLTLNPVVIFVSLMFWTWLWGIAGALISVPLLMTVKIVCDHFKPLTPVSEFLSG